MWCDGDLGKNSGRKEYAVRPMLHNYKIDPTGKEKIVTQTGKVVTGVTGIDAQSADGFGYISHFATCKSANNFRRGRK